MTYADYYLCDACGKKTFCDSNLSYEYRDLSDKNYNEMSLHPWPCGNVGFMLVLCKVCAKTHKAKIDVIVSGLELSPDSWLPEGFPK